MPRNPVSHFGSLTSNSLPDLTRERVLDRIRMAAQYGSNMELDKLEQLALGMGISQNEIDTILFENDAYVCLLYTSPSPRDRTRSRMPSSA